MILKMASIDISATSQLIPNKYCEFILVTTPSFGYDHDHGAQIPSSYIPPAAMGHGSLYFIRHLNTTDSQFGAICQWRSLFCMLSWRDYKIQPRICYCRFDSESATNFWLSGFWIRTQPCLHVIRLLSVFHKVLALFSLTQILPQYLQWFTLGRSLRLYTDHNNTHQQDQGA